MARSSWWKRALLLLWEAPQNILGAGTLAAHLARGSAQRVAFADERVFIELRGDGAVSLGLFVFFSCKDNRFVPVGAENRDHEYGHSLQSRLLGPLYLPLVGLPSTMRVAYAMLYFQRHRRRWAHYYDAYPERWADVLGAVDRTLRPPP